MRKVVVSSIVACALLQAGVRADCGPFFAAPLLLANGPVSSSDLAVADLDNDGPQEIVYASRATNGGTGITVFRQNFAGAYENIQFLPLPTGQTTMKFILADVDVDGLLDLVVTEYAAGSVRIHLGNGDGTFSTNYVAYAVGPEPTALVLKDLNNDQRPDLIVSNLSDGTISVLMGAAGGGFFPRATYPAGGSQPAWVGLTDFNGDGRDDLVTTVSQPAAIAVSMGNGNGSFQSPRIFPTGANLSLRTPVIQDMTADGVPDITVADGSNQFYIFRGVPNGTLSLSTIICDGVLGGIANVAVADYDGNALPDVCALTGFQGMPLTPLIYRNRGVPNFDAPLGFGQAGVYSTGAYATHFDRTGDGLPDLLYVDRFGQVCIMEMLSGGPVQVLERPENLFVVPGATARFSVQGVGAGISYQWFKDGRPLLPSAKVQGTDAATLTISDAAESDSAVYECRVSNPCASRSVSAFLAVRPASPECPVDFDGDGFIDAFDYDAFVTAFEQGC